MLRTLEQKKEYLDRNYKKIEALYHKGYSTEDIMMAAGMNKRDVLEIEQTIFGRRMMYKERNGLL